MFEERLKSLVEKRIIEAAKKEITKKLHVIVKAFGQPIVEQTMSYSMLPDFWELESPDILEVEDDVGIYLKGYYFDGLRRGININIKLIFCDSKPVYLEVQYHGYKVYMETEGELKSYVPHKEWEDAIDRLYNYAKPVEATKIITEAEKQQEKDKKFSRTIIQRFKALWGY